MNVFRFIFFFCSAVVLFLIIGCNDAPNSVGKGSQLNKRTMASSISIHFMPQIIPRLQMKYITSSIDRFMLGKYKTYQAWACLKFYSWPDSLIGIKITSASIHLKSVYHFGDSLAPLSFNVYRAMSKLFLSDSLTYDSLKLNSVTSANGIYYNRNNQVPISYSTIPFGDTDAITINILDTTMLREWFSTNTDTVDFNDGIIFRPTNSNVIKGFYSFNTSDTSLQPTLYVSYIDTNGIPYHGYPLKSGSCRICCNS